MRYAVLGAGLMGTQVARDLLQSEGVTHVTLADVDVQKASDIVAQLDDDRIKANFVDAQDEEQLAQVIKGHDMVVNALFYTFNEVVAKTAMKVGVHACDLGGHIGHATDHILQWNEEAQRAGVTYVPDLGVAPGMINILTGHGVRQLDEAENISIRVGGIPLRPEPPFGYNHVFSIEGVFDHYTDPSLIIRNGESVYVPAMSEVETLYFEKFGPLEAFHTSGGTSTLPHTFPHVKNLDYKTIRYPGHAEKFKLLVDLQLTDRDYHVQVGEQKVKPRDVLREVLAPRLDLKDKDDVVLLRVCVDGQKDEQYTEYQYELITIKDRDSGVTAMARATAYTVSVVAQMIANGVISERGVFCPEQVVPGEAYMQEMAKRGVEIKEKASQNAEEGVKV